MAVALFVGAGAPGAKRLAARIDEVSPNGCNTAFACFCYRFFRPPDQANSSMDNSDWMMTMSGVPSPNQWGLAFNHLGLAAKDPKAAAQFLTGLGYRIGPIILTVRTFARRSAPRTICPMSRSFPRTEGRRSARQVACGQRRDLSTICATRPPT